MCKAFRVLIGLSMLVGVLPAGAERVDGQSGAQLSNPQQAAAPTTWVMSTEYPETNISGEGIATFARLVGEQSESRLIVTPTYDGKNGISGPSIVPAVRDGSVQAADAIAGPLETFDPIFAISSLPFAVRSVEASKRLVGLTREAYRTALAKNGVHLLYVTIWPATGLWSKRSIATPADLQGLTTRSYDRNSADVMASAGADAVFLPFGEAVTRLRNGTLDAILSSGDGGAGRKLWEYLPHFTVINYAVPVSIAFVQTEAYASLPPDLQAMVDRAARETEEHQWARLSTREAENFARMRENHMAIADNISPELRADFAHAARATLLAWKQKVGPERAGLLDQLDPH
jgi:TRAP-type C4-dicarboxylate transport system substrate-binding protein